MYALRDSGIFKILREPHAEMSEAMLLVLLLILLLGFIFENEKLIFRFTVE